MFALVDCNACFASCETIFRPELRDKPVIVLSNNDGCVVARNAAAKALGIPDLHAYFKIEHILKKHNVAVFSSNFPLYGDISNRVMATLKRFSPYVEIYSIDEMFLDFFNTADTDFKTQGQVIKQTVWKEVRMPVSVGMAPTKTLAKLANRAAKKIAQTNGVCLLDQPYKWRWLQARLPVNAIWGIGARLSRRLNALGIHTVKQLADANPKYLRKQFSVNIERTICELNGESCIAIEDKPPAKQQIYCTRSFGERVYDLASLQQAVCVYVGRAAQKLRQQKHLVKTIHVYVTTSRFDTNYYYNSTMVPLDFPTNDTREMIRKVRQAVVKLFKPGYAYAKAGIGLVELIDEQFLQTDLFHSGQSTHAFWLMDALDNINYRYGRDSIFLAAEGVHKKWKMRQLHRSPAYTTSWLDLPTINLG